MRALLYTMCVSRSRSRATETESDWVSLKTPIKTNFSFDTFVCVCVVCLLYYRNSPLQLDIIVCSKAAGRIHLDFLAHDFDVMSPSPLPVGQSNCLCRKIRENTVSTVVVLS